jgi:hypothetical protein
MISGDLESPAQILGIINWHIYEMSTHIIALCKSIKISIYFSLLRLILMGSIL